MTDKQKELYICLPLLGLLVLLICLCNPLHPFSQKPPGEDSSYFILIGSSINKGVMPYSDINADKGPLIFLLNWFGMTIGGFTFVWLMEFICMLFSVWFCYKTARRFFGETVSFFSTFFSFIPLFTWFEGGNLTESWALPLISASAYWLTAYFVQDFNLQNRQVFFSGLCMGAVLMLRPNMFGIWAGLCIVIFIHSLAIRRYKNAVRYIYMFIAGVAAVIIPIVIWLAWNDALLHFFDIYFMHNISNTDDLHGAIIHVLDIATTLPVLPAVIISILFVTTKRWTTTDMEPMLSWAIAISLGVSIVLAHINGRGFAHYNMVLVPCMILPVAWAVQAIMAHVRYSVLTVIMVGLIFNYQSILAMDNNISAAFQSNTAHNELVTFINENTADEEPVLYVGYYPNIHLYTGRPVSGYHFIFPAGWTSEIKQVMAYEFIDQLNTEKTRLIMYGNRELPEVLQGYINDNYTIVAEFEPHVVCIRN